MDRQTADGDPGALKQLSTADAKRLAAGQLVTDPCAVVKELVENALDAGATSVSVTISKDLTCVQVKDNGCGVDARGRELVGHAHCTSKLAELSDLPRVASFGFRGEALHHIVEAAEEVEIVTKTASEAVGASLLFRNGEQARQPVPSPSPTGTSVKVTGLFHRFPVRRKALQQNVPRELTRLSRLLLTFALQRPSLRLVCSRPFLQKLPVPDIRTTMKNVFGPTVVKELAFFDWEAPDGSFHISGYWPRPGCDTGVSGLIRSGQNDRMFIFVNSRAVRVVGLEKLITRLFRECNPDPAVSRKFPLIFMDITVPAGSFDVNVSPDKSEILFASGIEEQILEHVNQALLHSASQHTTPSPTQSQPQAEPTSSSPLSKGEEGRGSGVETGPTGGGSASNAINDDAESRGTGGQPALLQRDQTASAAGEETETDFEEAPIQVPPQARPMEAKARVVDVQPKRSRTQAPQKAVHEKVVHVSTSMLLQDAPCAPLNAEHASAAHVIGLVAITASRDRSSSELKRRWAFIAASPHRSPNKRQREGEGQGDSLPPLILFDAARCREQALFLNLFHSLEIGRSRLDTSVRIDAQFPHLREAERERILSLLRSSLSQEAADAAAVSSRVALPRLFLLNGFGLRLRRAAELPESLRTVELVEVPSEPSISVLDFVELCRQVLSFIDSQQVSDSQPTSFPVLRPHAIRSLLVAESARLSGSSWSSDCGGATGSNAVLDEAKDSLACLLRDADGGPSVVELAKAECPHGRPLGIVLHPAAGGGAT